VTEGSVCLCARSAGQKQLVYMIMWESVNFSYTDW